MRIWIFAALISAACNAGAQSAVSSSAPETFAQWHEAALTAYQSKNFPAMEAALRRADVLRPHFPRTIYNLAAAAALQGRKDEALAGLERLTRMKLAYKAGADEDFISLREMPRFKEIIERFDKYSKHLGRANFAFSAGVNSFMPEGIAYDEDSGAFFLSSVHQRRILKSPRSGENSSLIGSARHGIWSVLGMQVESSRNRLWAASSALPEMEGFGEENRGRAGLFAFDVDSGTLRAKFLLPKDGKEHVLGDVLVASTGELYTTDSAAGVLYEVSRKDGKYTALTASGALESPQGLTFSKDKKKIYLADYNRGLFRFDLEKKTLERVAVPDDICAYGIDGLYRYQNTLVAIQNGTRPNRVVQFQLDDAGLAVTDMKLLSANHPDFDEPTLGLIKKGIFFFVANSQWNRVGADHKLPPEDQMRRPVVLRIDLRE